MSESQVEWAEMFHEAADERGLVELTFTDGPSVRVWADKQNADHLYEVMVESPPWPTGKYRYYQLDLRPTATLWGYESNGLSYDEYHLGDVDRAKRLE